MDTATQINNLLLHLDRAALALTTPEHPDVEVRLGIDCTLPEATHILDYAMSATQPTTGGGVQATLTPVHGRCGECGAIYTIPSGTHDIYCPACASRRWAPTQAR
jgi:hypothetical protein